MSKSKRSNNSRHFEKELAIEHLLKFQLRGRSVSCYVLKTPSNPNLLQFVFGWAAIGIHTTLSEERESLIFDALQRGLSDIPVGESLTVYFDSYNSDRDRQQELQNIYDTVSTQELKFLAMSDKARVQELSGLGLRKPKSLRFFATHTIQGTDQSDDNIEKALVWLQTVIKGATRQDKQIDKDHYEQLFSRAFIDGFLNWEQLLLTRMGLDLRPLSDVELWQSLWDQFNLSPAPPIPHLLIMKESGLEEQYDSDIHIKTKLLSDFIPFADRSFVHLKNEYTAVLTFIEKPGGWASKGKQMRYLWDVFARDSVINTTAVCQFTRANEDFVKNSMQRLTKQSIIESKASVNSNNVNVTASKKESKSIEAQEAIYDGAVPINVAVVFLIRRPNLELLDDACRYFSSCFSRPAWIERESEYAWLIWKQTLPISFGRLLSKPFNRSHIYFSDEAVAFTSMVMPKSLDKSGLELISEEGGMPIFIDITKHRNIAIFGTTRSGKSVFISAVLNQALYHDQQIVVLDYPKPDGSSTFTDYTAFLGSIGAYFDIGKESSNIFELPDLRSFDSVQVADRLQETKSFVLTALLTMVYGSGQNDLSSSERQTRSLIRSFLVPVVDGFYQDPSINLRFERAIADGFGSEAWQETPTLSDFYQYFLSFGRSNIQADLSVEQNGDIDKAINLIIIRLKFWMSSPVGQAISRPSTFRSDSKLLVFALRNLSESEDAAILVLSAYSAALRRSLASTASIFFVDEFSLLSDDFPAISEMVGKLCANGAKSGIKVIISAQDPDAIGRSALSSKILQNLSTILVGRIKSTAIDSFQRILKYPKEVIQQNAEERFYPKRELVYSQWLLDDAGTHTFVRFYPSYVQLGVVANNPDEQVARTAYMADSANPFKGLANFTNELVSSLKDNRPIQLPKEKK
jgi:hypothetical protein